MFKSISWALLNSDKANYFTESGSKSYAYNSDYLS